MTSRFRHVAPVGILDDSLTDDAYALNTTTLNQQLVSTGIALAGHSAVADVARLCTYEGSGRDEAPKSISPTGAAPTGGITMRSKTRFPRIAGIVAVVAACLGPMAEAAPFLSGPSIVFLGDTVTLSGGGYAPGSFVNVAIVPASGASSAQAHATDGTGRIEVAVVATVAGLYVVTVTDAAGTTLASAQFIVN